MEKGEKRREKRVQRREENKKKQKGRRGRVSEREGRGERDEWGEWRKKNKEIREEGENREKKERRGEERSRRGTGKERESEKEREKNGEAEGAEGRESKLSKDKQRRERRQKEGKEQRRESAPRPLALVLSCPEVSAGGARAHGVPVADVTARVSWCHPSDCRVTGLRCSLCPELSCFPRYFALNVVCSPPARLARCTVSVSDVFSSAAASFCSCHMSVASRILPVPPVAVRSLASCPVRGGIIFSAPLYYLYCSFPSLIPHASRLFLVRCLVFHSAPACPVLLACVCFPPPRSLCAPP
ncbi:hypothetical protein Tco_0671979 [Tanacetum coccineum]